MKKQKVLIVGAGLTGSLMAIYLAQKGFLVEVFEKRSDLRLYEEEEGRSINLALSHRGIRAMAKVGVADQALKIAVPMLGRMLHSIEKEETFVPYGKDNSEYINSISRAELNQLLLNVADQYDEVSIHFETKCEAIHFQEARMEVRFSDSPVIQKVYGDVILAADGAGSMVRQDMQQFKDYASTSELLDHRYKELTIPTFEDEHKSLDKNSLHIWPRGSFMLIALPNRDGSFTCTLFLAQRGQPGFDTLKDEVQIKHFFETYFSDVVPLMPNLVEEFINRPLGIMGTVKSFPWFVGDKVLLLGDAAHAIVPFYGQGMNASFEDCLVLSECIDKYDGNWKQVFLHYQELRKINTDAIAQLAIENFYEMRDGVSEPAFLRKRKLEHLLENKYSDYHSKYSLVTFHPQISYYEAHQRGNQQNKILLDLCRKVDSVAELDLEEVYWKLKKEVKF